MKVSNTLGLLLLTSSSNALLGLGQDTLYPPDACGNACLAYFKTYRLTCSTLKEPSSHSGHGSAAAPVYVTSNKCRATNYPYIASVAWCWERNCLEISNISNKKFVHAWSEAIPGVNETSFIDALSKGAPTKYDVPKQKDPFLNEPVLVDDELFNIKYTTTRNFKSAELTAARMGFTLIMITWALEKCSVPLSLTEGIPIDYVPPRIVSLTIAAYYIINILFCAVPYRAYWEFAFYSHNTYLQMCMYVGNRTGILSFANIPVLILFASRNNIYQWLTGWSYATFQHYHRHVSIICTLEAIVHSIIYTAKYLHKPNNAAAFAKEAAKPYFVWGIVATVICSIMPALAVLKLRRMSYEIFMFFHYVFAALFIVGCYYHVYIKFKVKYGYVQWIYASIAVWAFDIVMRFAKIMYIKFRGCKSKCVVELVDHESKTLKLTYTYPHAKQTTIGNYYYLYFTTVFPFFTSHPFTVAEWHDPNHDIVSSTSDSEDSSKNEEIIEKSRSTESTISFYVQVQKGTTRKIYRQLEANDFKPIEIFSFLEGPYGTYESGTFDDHDFVILLTGGIGNTVVLNYLMHFVQYKNHKCLPNDTVKLSIMQSDRFNSRLDFLKSRIDAILPKRMSSDVEIDLHSTLNSARLDVAQYLNDKVTSIETTYPRGTRRIAVVCCGPPKFNDVCRRTCVELQTKIQNDTVVNYVTDPFEW
ncbi:hypothetical protein CANINC_001960 [Pichia inconspicua]|uniref:FAD-binding FR-type domain-containing protein n=1 Tax=Pichia inconspicua TaxID=52247 RepID=A0A4T0X3M0_9ASCO|nr:hypothetical protein CANINC_001960 [[Candida] inconspicua]